MKVFKKSKMQKDERFVPEYNFSMFEHVHRYALASKLCNGGTVLDVASGEGYGTALLAKKASLVIGVEIDNTSVAAATKKYNASNLQFRQGSVTQLPLQDKEADMVVSFETLEHVNEQEQMISEIKRVVKQNGIVVISTPDKKMYSDLKNFNNPHHVKELYKSEFIALISRFFKHLIVLKQKSFFCSFIGSDEANSAQIHFFQGDYDKIQEVEDVQGEYIIIIASDERLDFRSNSILYDERFQQKIEAKVKRSTRYRFGDMVLNPIKFWSGFSKR